MTPLLLPYEYPLLFQSSGDLSDAIVKYYSLITPYDSLMTPLLLPYEYPLLFQSLGDVADAILGHLRPHRFGQFRVDRDQGVHPILRPPGTNAIQN